MTYNPAIHHRRSIRLQGYDYSRPGAYFITICVQDRLHLFGEVKQGKMVLNDFGIIVVEEWKRSEEIRQEITLEAFVIMPNHIHGILIINKMPESNRIDRDQPMGIRTETSNPTMGDHVRATGHDDIARATTHDDIARATAHDDIVGATGRSPLRFPPNSHPNNISPLPNIHQIEQWAISNPNGPKPKSLGSFVAGFKPAVTKRINEIRKTPGSPVWQRNYYDHIIRNEQEFAAIRYYIINNPVKWREDLFHPDKKAGCHK